MTKKDWFGIAYVSIWVVIWGSFGSIVDLPLLNAGIYLPGSIGQITTFSISALISFLVGFLIFPKLTKFFE